MHGDNDRAGPKSDCWDVKCPTCVDEYAHIHIQAPQKMTFDKASYLM